MDPYRYMIPGPVQLAPEVLEEMGRPVVPHYGAEWTAFYNETVCYLRRIIQTSGDVYVIPGSGSAGLDAAINTILAEGERLLVLSNGFFGDRLAEIAQHYREDTLIARRPASERIVAADLDMLLADHPEVTWVAVCHSESSSGLLNPVRDLADVCKRRGVRILVDAISSLGGIELSMDAWRIDVCVSASQKCLEGPPGLAIVAIGDDAWAQVRQGTSPGWYTNLRVWSRYAEAWADWHPYPITMAVPAFRGLRAGLERVLKEGLSARFLRHLETADFLRRGAASLGFDPVFSAEQASPTVVALRGRDDLSAADTVHRLAEEHRIKVAQGMGEFKSCAFRVGNMGIQASQEQMDALLGALARLPQEREATS